MSPAPPSLRLRYAVPLLSERVLVDSDHLFRSE
eukprot:CAMPEP_0174374054 /NCGR_PEP_ID=MMETSP0811_2-20130205/109457_1 /TAXON_ID=73025 ORGANISM="Eutreptiella gymnastica-like, Strain CCMP1594" /NCGR_SAMPLE_ID=MMETSP0811_2 /ASSEMBLY_ACC=CAM_ASM_000667 /LENGTH=32 /DNA_ID= /DNA_START= /DNA_END= /DNA_ORIENTATION=